MKVEGGELTQDADAHALKDVNINGTSGSNPFNSQQQTGWSRMHIAGVFAFFMPHECCFAIIYLIDVAKLAMCCYFLLGFRQAYCRTCSKGIAKGRGSSLG